MRGSRWFRCTVPVLVIVLATVGLGACRGSQEPSPRRISPGPETLSSTPSPSPSPSLDEQALIEEAIAALTEYLALANEVENAGGEGWEEKLKPWWGNDLMQEVGASHFTAMLEGGYHHEGSSFIRGVPAGSVDRETRTVVLHFCLDAREVVARDASGDSIADIPADPFPSEAELSRVPGRWHVLSLRVDQESTC